MLQIDSSYGKKNPCCPEPRCYEYKYVETKCCEPKYSDPCCYEPKCYEPKCYESKCCQPKCCEPCCPEMNDCLAKKIECIWKQAFCDSTIIPQIGVPSCAKCVMTLTHTLGKCLPKLKINGLCTLSPLANNGFYSAEVSCCKWINLYQIQLPNIPGECGCKSSGEVYTEALIKLGISVDSIGLGWVGSCPNLTLFHSKAIDMDPCTFSQKQIAALKAVIEYFLCDRCC